MRTLFCLLLLALSGLLLTPVFAAAEQTMLRVAYTEWFPYTYTENGVAAGFEIDILKEVAASLGLSPHFSSYPWKRCLAYAQSGETDAVVSMLKTEERETYVWYPQEHISVSRTSFFRLLTKPVNYAGDLDQLKPYKIGVISGFDYGPAFAKAEYLYKDESVDAKTLLAKLLLERIDLAAENEAVFSAQASRQQAQDKIVPLTPPLQTRLLYVAFTKAKPWSALAQRFSEALAEFKKSERFQQILEKYGVAPSTQ